MRTALVMLLACAVFGVGLREARADVFAPYLLDVAQNTDGTFDVHWKLPAANNLVADITPAFPAHCHAVDTQREASATSLSERWTLDCGAAGLRGYSVGFNGLTGQSDEVIVRFASLDDPPFTGVVRAAQPVVELPAASQQAGTVRTYVVLGFEHILAGADHLLFVLGLMLVVRSRRALLATITAFTLGHSVTLALVSLGMLSLRSQPVEAVIALSIVLLAVEAAKRRRDTLTTTYPWLIAAGCGLIHGAGFAGALREIGLPEGDVPLALVSFNVGVELGQLAFVAVVGAVALLGRRVVRHPVWHARARLVVSYAIGCMATAWLIDRMAPAVAAAWG